MKYIKLLLLLLIVSLGASCVTSNPSDDQNGQHVHSYVDGVCSCGDIYVQKYCVRFINEDGSILKEEHVKANESAVAPIVSPNEGYNFIGWDQDFTNVTSDLDVYALFEQITLKVIFYNANGGILKEQIVSYGDSIKDIEEVKKVGYDFLGWDQDLNNIKTNLEVHPILVKKTFTVKFYDFYGNLLDEQVVAYGSTAKEPILQDIEGYEFLGWDQAFKSVSKNLDIKPIYKNIEELSYTVTFVDMYGEIINEQTVKHGEDAEAVNVPSVRYYTFNKWDQDFTNVTSDLVISPIYTKNSISYQINDANYWMKIIAGSYNITKEILSKQEINKYNEFILSDYAKTKVVDVTKLEKTVSNSYVNGLVTRYSNINKYSVYNETTNIALSTNEKTAILNNRNLNNISSSVDVKFGLIADFAWLRSYPTNHYSNDYDMDRFQETSLNVGEGVAIYHESLDGNWYFVQAENYNGWLEKKYVCECSYDEMVSFLNPDNRLLVISDYVIINESHVRMGQTFPLINSSNDLYTILFPTVNEDGTSKIEEIEVAVTSDYHVGYLTYTYENIMKQAFKLLGIDYSWGDKSKYGRDCSSTMNAVYKCFGFMMPRNTSNQVAIPNYGSKVSGVSTQTMKNYCPGTLIFTSSHVMMYLGEDIYGNAYLLHNTTSGDGACILQSLDGYGGSRINGILKLQ